MLQSIRCLSLSEFRRVEPEPRTVVISILARDEAHERPLLTGFRSALLLEFYDAYETPDIEWPDHVDVGDAPSLCRTPAGERPPSIADAAAIASFCNRHHASPEPLHLVVHCYAGLSRSAAVAAWAAKTFGLVVEPVPGRDLRLANPRLARFLSRMPSRAPMAAHSLLRAHP